eukprot:402868_1
MALDPTHVQTTSSNLLHTLNEAELNEFAFTSETLQQYVIKNKITIHSLSMAPLADKTYAKLGRICYIKSNYIGNQLVMLLPISIREVFHDKNKLLDLIIDAITFGAQINIQYVTLMGTIPSATNYGKDVVEKLKSYPSLKNIIVTTSHATTLACVAINCEYMLNKADRQMENEIVGVLGCGSIGFGSILTIMATINVNNYPRKIILCDVQKRLHRLEQLKRELYTNDEVKYNGHIEIVISDVNKTNELFYESTLIIGASNKSKILQVDKLNEGCMVIDDSAPHCFDVNDAIKRLNEKNDVIFTEGGLVRLPFYENVEQFGDETYTFGKDIIDHYIKRYEIFSCSLGGMLLHRFPNKVTPILAPAEYKDGIERLKLFREIGITGVYTSPRSFGKCNMLSAMLKVFCTLVKNCACC